MTKDAKSGSIRMRPRARLIGLIGEELISDEPVALVELVKNSYDADATRVEVRFEGADPTRPERIVVADDGIGMSLDTVLTAWFEPGTIVKRKQTLSPGGRLYQGAKGIGRFASARLAESLYMESRQEGQKEGVVVLLEWGLFTEDAYLDEINLEYEVRPLPGLPHGTRLVLDSLRKVWQEEDYDELHARLSRMISPFQKDVLEFEVLLDAPAYPQVSGDVQPPELILEPKYLLEGGIDAEGRFTGQMLLDGKPHKSYERRKLGEAGKGPGCGPFEIEIRAWDRDREGLGPLIDRFNLGVRQIRQTLDTYCGVSIYRDGFRVYPYGQKGNDWLGLDLRSRQNPVKNLANNQMVASLRISRLDNPGLQDRSTREGMIINAEHTALEDWFVEALAILEEERYDLRPRQKEADRGEPLFEPFDFSATVARAKRELGTDHPVARLIADTEKQVSAGVERLQETFSRLLMSSGLGHMVDIVIHEIGSPLGKVNRQLAVLEKLVAEELGPTARKRAETMFTSIKGWLEQIHNLRGRLEPQTPAKRGRATAFNLGEEIEDNFRLYDALISKQKIKVRLKFPDEPLRVRMSRAAFGQILVNLLDNSIFWIARTKGDGNGGRIRVDVDAIEHGFRILFCDDGPGVAEEDQGRIFEPYFTRKPNGMGLGLYIARMIIEPYGRLVYRTDGVLPGACFEARFETRVGR